MKIGVYTFHEGKEPKDLENEIKKLKKQLEIAVEVLESFAIDEFYDKNVAYKSAKALNKIKKLNRS